MKEHDVYRALSIYNTAKAIRKGPKATAKRAARIVAYREFGRLIRRILR